MIAAASAVSALPAMARMGPSAVTAAGQRIGAAIHSSAHGDKIVKAAQIAEAFLNPNAPTAPSAAAFVGTAASRVVEELQRRREQSKK